tara:strand:- start:149 stop:262 length:114 start_codon:yes stop_codon:yes gene_type:complete
MAVEVTSYDEWLRAKVQAAQVLIDAKRQGQSMPCAGP